MSERLSAPAEVHVLATAAQMVRAAAQLVAAVASERCRAAGRFSIALSGGTTPARLYETLASPPYVGRLAWGQWQVYWSDERCVPSDHPESNYGLARRTLLDHVPIVGTNIHRVRGEGLPETAAAEYEQEVCAVSAGAVPVFDLVLLGLGADGHTASLFPGTTALEAKDRLVLADWVPQLGAHRITFSLPLINAARVVAFMVDGATKAEAVRQVLRPAPEAALLPAARVHPASGKLHWFLTAAAASRLSAE